MTASEDTRAPAASAGEPVRRSNLPDGIARLTFDRPGKSANVFDRATFVALDRALEALERASDVRGLILDSAKPSIFLAGADVEEIRRITKPDEIRAAIERGQRVFDRLAKLEIPSVAAIHGVCLGGGLELALACDWRVASTDSATKLGFPEVLLGILPAWGGSTRLPRLIGITKALPILLTGSSMPAELARKRGVVDRTAPKEHLERVARELLRGGKRKTPRHFFQHGWPLLRIVKRKALENVERKTGGHYPAPKAIVEVACDGLEQGRERSLELERQRGTELIASDISRRLVDVFFLQERAKKLTTLPPEETASPAPVERMAVIGAGVMGAGIAQWSASRGLPVILRDLDPERVRAGLASVAKTLAGAVRKHKMTKREAQAATDRITPAAADVPLGRCDLVIEAAVENLGVKREIFADLDERTSTEAILATNTSSLSVTDIAAGLDTAGRVVGILFFNPVHRMKLVEVVRGERTDARTVERAVRWVQRIGKLPVVTADRPGFVVNRVLMPYLFEAVHLFEQGASIDAVDGAMKAFGMPMGPLRLLDEVGLDVAAHVGSHVATVFGDRLPISPLLERMNEKGWRGAKAGEGFYDHPKSKREKRGKAAAEKARDSDVRRLVTGGGSSAANLTRDALAERMVLLMIDEAARVLEESVVEDPRDVDFAMIMGTGFAPFRGGPLRHADAIGLRAVRDALLRLSDSASSRFEPCARIREMADRDATFYPPD